MASFGDYKTAAQFRDLVKEIVRGELRSQRPTATYGTVTATGFGLAQVLLPDGTSPILPCPGFIPTVGERVRIAGESGDRFVDRQITGAPLVQYAELIVNNDGESVVMDSLIGPPDAWDPVWSGSAANHPSYGNAVKRSHYKWGPTSVRLHLDIEWGSTTDRGSNTTYWNFTLPIDATPNHIFTGTGAVLIEGIAWEVGFTALIDNRASSPTQNTLIMMREDSATNNYTHFGANYPRAFADSYPTGSRFVADIEYTPDVW